MKAGTGDEALIRRATRTLALQAAALVAAAMLLLVGLVSLILVHNQRSLADATLRASAAQANDVVDPPAGSWIVLSQGNEVTASAGLPAVVARRLAGLRAEAGSGARLATIATGDDRSYRVVTVHEPGRTVQVVLDLAPQQNERARLLAAMAAAAGLSLVVAGGLGVLLGRRAVRPLAEALRLQRSFVTDASHELRTPLTLLSTRVQVLERELLAAGSGPQPLADCRGVVGDVQRLGEVVEDLLVAADPRSVDEHRPVDLAALTEGVVASAAAHAAGAGIGLSMSGGTGLTVLGSAVALRRALLALLDNAIDHTPSGGLVDMIVSRRRESVVVTVRDTGPGIAAGVSAQRRVQRFHSGGQRSGRAHYGLGLALTNDVANRHGGQLRLLASSTGTTFELILPTCAD